MHTIAVIGLGNRGSGYLRWLKKFCGERAEVVALCDKSEVKLTATAALYHVKKERCYTSEEAFFAAGKLAEAIFICTGDRMHYAEAVKAIELGYQVMLEKPIAPSLAECADLERRAKEKGVHVVICHVLRYIPYYIKLRELVQSGRYGKVMSVNHTENIGYFHFAHSYVRGNWRREDETTPMLLAKSCHDFDLIDWYLGGGCRSVSSVGKLSYFNAAHAPANAGKRCLDCPAAIKKACPYDAERLYITDPVWRATFLRYMGDVVTGKPHHTRADLYEALRTGPYGRCVYACDNDVCDHQSALLDYGDTFVTINVTAFAQKCFRRTIIHLEGADIVGEDDTGRITIRAFGKGVQRMRVGLIHIVHREGDQHLVRAFIDLLDGVPADLTFLSDSIESHRLVFAAEESRLHDGARIEV